MPPRRVLISVQRIEAVDQPAFPHRRTPDPSAPGLGASQPSASNHNAPETGASPPDVEHHGAEPSDERHADAEQRDVRQCGTEPHHAQQHHIEPHHAEPHHTQQHRTEKHHTEQRHVAPHHAKQHDHDAEQPGHDTKQQSAELPSTEPSGTAQPGAVDRGADLEAVLAAWQTATDRLSRTHQLLRAEVRRLTDELQVKNRELARKNRLADLGQIASHVAHEVRNNLVPVALYLSLLRRRLSDDAGSLDILAKIEGGITALDATVNDLLHFASGREPRFETIEIRPLIQGVLDQLAPQLAAQQIRVELDVDPRHQAWADRGMLERAVLNLALNALDVMPQGGELVITSHQDDTQLELEVADSGPGLSDEVRRRVFDPFFTTKSGGTGLGLAIVSRIAEGHGGTVLAQNCHEGGAAFTLRLPRRTQIREMAA